MSSIEEFKDAVAFAVAVTALLVGGAYWAICFSSTLLGIPVPGYVLVLSAFPLLYWAYQAHRYYNRIKDVEFVESIDLSGRG